MYRRHLIDKAEFEQHHGRISAQMNSLDENEFFLLVQARSSTNMALW